MENDGNGHRITSTNNRIQIFRVELVEVHIGVHLTDSIGIGANDGVDIRHFLIPAITILAPIVPHEFMISSILEINSVVCNHFEQLLFTKDGALAERLSSIDDNHLRGVSHKEVETIDAVNVENRTVTGIGIEDIAESDIGVGHRNMEVIFRSAEEIVFVVANLLGEFAEDRISKSVRFEDLAAARLVTADEVGGFVLIPGEVVPSGTADALTQVHNQSVVTNLFPFELEEGSGLGEEVIIEVVKCFCVDGGHAHGGDKLAELVHDAVGSTLANRKGAGVVGRGVARDAVEHVGSHSLLAAAEAVGHSAAEPRDAVTLAQVVELSVKGVNVKVHIVGQMIIHIHPFPVLVLALQNPVEGDFGLGLNVAVAAKEQLVQLSLTNVGVAVIVIRVVRVDKNPVTQRMLQRQFTIGRHLHDTEDGVGLQVLKNEPALRLRTEAQKPQ